MLKIENKDTEEEEEIPMLRYYNVFKVGEQTEGIETKRKEIDKKHNPIKEAEALINNYEDKPLMTSNNEGAYYQPDLDIVNVPKKNHFYNIHEYYSTMFHELVHSTGHEKRLNRAGVTNFDRFGSERYSKEELVAEIGASMLCGVAGIEHKTIDNSASYIKSWLQALEDDKTLIVKASQQAQKSSDYIQDIKDKKKAVS